MLLPRRPISGLWNSAAPKKRSRRGGDLSNKPSQCFAAACRARLDCAVQRLCCWPEERGVAHGFYIEKATSSFSAADAIAGDNCPVELTRRARPDLIAWFPAACFPDCQLSTASLLCLRVLIGPRLPVGHVRFHGEFRWITGRGADETMRMARTESCNWLPVTLATARNPNSPGLTNTRPSAHIFSG